MTANRHGVAPGGCHVLCDYPVIGYHSRRCRPTDPTDTEESTMTTDPKPTFTRAEAATLIATTGASTPDEVAANRDHYAAAYRRAAAKYAPGGTNPDTELWERIVAAGLVLTLGGER